MASVEEYRLKNGTRRWMVRWRMPDGTERKKRGFERKRDAKFFGDDQENLIRRGKWTIHSVGRRRFAEWADDYLARKRAEVTPGTYENLRGRIQGYLVPAFGALPIDAIRPSHILRWRDGLGTRISPSTVNSMLGTLRQIFRFAENELAIEWNPCEKVPAVLVDNRRARGLAASFGDHPPLHEL